jgi:hypothetical protein
MEDESIIDRDNENILSSDVDIFFSVNFFYLERNQYVPYLFRRYN